ncbi:MAG TPA: oxygen-independent coproporphyrinogen III oxidase [Pseudolabrys sp.]|nr:oxygen-independent coproporphyrinogen III oxidase [Pseudolabrys sp.]
MLLGKVASAERTVPRYTSYPTAPHFVSSIGAAAYAAWLGELSRPDTVSLYIHIPFCRQMCLYCGCHTRATRRAEPVEAYAGRLVREIKLLAGHAGCRRVVHLHWGGGTPSILGPDLLRQLVALLDVHFDLTALREHAFELDPRYVTKDLARALSDIGVTRASLGVQDLSAHVQQVIGRVQPFAVVERAADTLRDTGISDLNVDLMYGLPEQTVDDVRRTVMLVHRLGPQRLAVFGYAHVPWIKRHQKVFDESALPRAAARFDQATAAHEALTALGYQPVGLDHYAMPGDSLAVAARAGTLRRNFQGYTTDDAAALIGLGASAIGRLRQGFVQNAPDTAGYSRAVVSGRFATVRGFALSADDRVRGRIIESLMCNLECNIDDVVARAAGEGDDAGDSFEQEIEALQPFVSDGFVRIDGRRIIVADSGRPYLRLIAATFDAYLRDSRARHSVAV